MKKIVVTVSSGKAGRTMVRYLLEPGYEVLSIDQTLAGNFEFLEFGSNFRALRANLTDFSETLEVSQGSSAVVHFGLQTKVFLANV